MKKHPPLHVRPMLATLVDSPFRKKSWVFEEKYDGYRILARKDGGPVRLFSRNDNDRTETFAPIARALEALSNRAFFLDGEAVVFDRHGVSRFQLLQQGRTEPVYALFDCLFESGRDLRQEPLAMRREALERLIGGAQGLRLSRRLSSDGLAAFRQARRRGFEGIVGKDESSPYVPGRSRFWLKVKVHQEEEFVIGGYTPPEGSRTHFGSLLLGAFRGKELVFVGKVGTGFANRTLVDLARRFRPLVRSKPAFANPPREKGAVWLEPLLVAQIGFQEWTADGKLRQPRYLGLRDDKSAREVRLPEGSP